MASFFIFVRCLTGGVTSLGEAPDWSKLDKFQGKWTESLFRADLENIYCPRKSWWEPWIKFEKEHVSFRKRVGVDDWYRLRLIKGDTSSSPVEPRNNRGEILKVALDPGHIGGKYSAMEGRHFQLGNDSVIKEGDISLQVAKRLKVLLDEEGFQTFLIREKSEPVTVQRPEDFEEMAEGWLQEMDRSTLSQKEQEELRIKRREVLFYRVSEIRARARKINRQIKPDLVVCLHLNAAPWGDPDEKELVERNDYHVLVNGCYMGGELAYDDQRFEMLYRLLSAWSKTEKDVAEEVGKVFHQKTGLPAFRYRGPNAIKVGAVPGVWGRNLLANRIYLSPVVFLEPYIANSKTEYARLQIGHYEGLKQFLGHERLPLIEEYAQTVCKALVEVREKLK
ncbi:MAG: N-acetylmuramoyl-L-alanine amidase [Opitutales bacterium]|nr:N-acetylmuramoyl-L-alanine amidase [Opitutales bacterium]